MVYTNNGSVVFIIICIMDIPINMDECPTTIIYLEQFNCILYSDKYSHEDLPTIFGENLKLGF